MPDRTPDGRWIVVDGRRWRAADPAIPETFRAELVQELMRARREVRSRGDSARPAVHDAKVALGERGDPWWEAPTDEGLRDRAAATIRALLRHRDPSTICPSDAARTIGGAGWRDRMPLVREVAVALRDAGEVEIQQGGESVGTREVTGPIRLAAGEDLPR